MGDKIEVIYSPVGPSSNEAGGTIFFHMTLTYTNSAGQSQYISAGPTTSNGSLQMSPVEQARQMNVAASQTLTNTPSVWGTLHVGGSGAFTRGDTTKGIDVVPRTDPNTGQPNPDAGASFYKETVTTNATLAQWNTIVATYNAIASLNLTYSPYTSNSNSVACTALEKAGLAVPPTDMLKFTPACGVKLPTTNTQLQNYLNSLQPVSNPWYQLSSSGGSDGSIADTIDYLNSGFFDFRTVTKTGTVTVQEVKDLTSHNLYVFDDVAVSGTNMDLNLMTDGLEVDVFGDYNFLDSLFTGFDIDAIGNNNIADLAYSNIDFYGSGNYSYGYGSTSWEYGEYYGFTGTASATDSTSASRGADKLVEAMSTSDDSDSEVVIPKRTTATDWAIIGVPA